MSYSQILKNEADDFSPDSYINNEYDVNCVSRYIQNTATKRISKITNDPNEGDVLTCLTSQSGTFNNPDLVGWQARAELLDLQGIGRVNNATYSINLGTLTQCTFNFLEYDNSPGLFGNFNSYFTIPYTYPVIYNASSYLGVTIQPSTSTFYLHMSLIVYNPLTHVEQIIGCNSLFINASDTAYTYYIGCSGQVLPTNINDIVYVQLHGYAISGTFYPSASITSGRFQLTSYKL